MAEVWTRRARQRQPTGAVAVDWSNPITRGFGVITQGSGAVIRNTAGSIQPVLMTGATMAPAGTANGLALRVTGQPTSSVNGNSGGFSILPTAVNLASQFTFVFVGTPTAFQTNAVAITGQINAYQVTGTNAPAMRWGPGLDVPKAKKLIAYANIGGIDRTITDSADSVEGVLYINVMAYNGSEFTLWKNGALVGSVSATGAVGVSAYVALTLLNDYQDMSFPRDGYFARGFTGDFYFAAAANRGLSRAEITRLSANPWQLFAPERRATYFFPTSGIPTLSAATATAITSTTATPRVTLTF